MYYIQVICEEIYIRKPDEDFDLVKFVDEHNYFPTEVLKDQFKNKSLLLVHIPEIGNLSTYYKFVTSSGNCIYGDFDIVGDSVGDKKYTLLTKNQVQEVLKELL